MRERVGLWLMGARGSVATTAVTGLLALRAGLVRPTGCVTEHLDMDHEVLPGWDDLVVGGHDIVSTPLDKRAEHLAASGLLPHSVFTAVAAGLREVDAHLRDGYHPVTHTGPLADAIARLAADITDFRDRFGLARVVVVNVTSTEPPVPALPEHGDLDLLVQALNDPQRTVLPASSVGAYAALTAGASYVDFTPSPGIRLPALVELARRQGLPYAGSDGKTGRPWCVRSWRPCSRPVPWTSGPGRGRTCSAAVTAPTSPTRSRPAASWSPRHAVWPSCSVRA
ncbi:hypothetical protein GCM10029964_043830 [Kibdelosporangium lantanae]